jgi:hypothetical protein
METREEGLSRLQRILNELGPGASLHTGDRWLRQLFGSKKTLALVAAEAFARQNECIFQYVHSDKTGIWIRSGVKEAAKKEAR